MIRNPFEKYPRRFAESLVLSCLFPLHSVAVNSVQEETDPPVTLSFSSASAEVREDGKKISVEVRLQTESTVEIRVDYATKDWTATAG